jgi:drug/metabolite transporter (DMT)-like permease
MTDNPGRSRTKGFLFAFAASLAASVTYVIAKPVLNVLDPITFGFFHLLFATVFSTIWILVRKELHQFKSLRPGLYLYLLIQSLLSFFGILSFWIGLSLIDPTSASLLNRLEVPITVLLGVIILKERFSGREAIGGILVTFGAVVMKYHAPPSLSQGFWWIILSSGCFGLMEALAKMKIKDVPPSIFLTVRNPVVMIMMAGLGFLHLNGIVSLPFPPEFFKLPDDPTKWILFTVATGFTGSFGARILYLYSLIHLEVSKTALVNQTQPLIVAVFSMLFLAIYPTSREVGAAVLILTGCVLLVQRRINLK